MAVASGLVIAAMALGWWFTGHGMIAAADSASYLGTAQNIAEGRGVTSPLAPETASTDPAAQVAARGEQAQTHWPPLYSTAIAVVHQAGAGLFQAARIVNVAALGAAVALLCVLAWTWAPDRWGVAVAAVVVVLLGPAPELALLPRGLLGASATVLSELAFLPFLLVVVAATAWLDVAPRRLAAVALGGVVGATLVRYVGAGLGLVPAGAILLLRRPLRRAWVAIALGLAAAGPATVVLWTKFSGVLWGGEAARGVRWHPPHDLSLPVTAMAGWVGIPAHAPLALRALAATALVAGSCALVASARLRRFLAGPAGDPRRASLLLALGLTVPSYLAITLASRALLDALIPLDSRILLPVQPVVGLTVVLVAHGLVERALAHRTHPVAHAARFADAAIVVAVLIVALTVGAGRTVRDDARLVDRTVHAPTAAGRANRFQGLPADTVIFTNQPSRMWFRTGLPTQVLPHPVDPLTDAPNQRFREQVQALGPILQDHPGLVVLGPDLLPNDSPTPADLDAVEGLARVATCDGELVWGVPGSAASTAIAARCA
ncbi:hypothetical protein [Aquihabitans sp. McL0605]|uniref:hypothetical protein n=1 Tax=Aquihabitans sp. McL0605 TaxID=3415671 RepID=UPI003CFA76D8